MSRCCSYNRRYSPTSSHISAPSKLPIGTSLGDDFFALEVPSLKCVVFLLVFL